MGDHDAIEVSDGYVRCKCGESWSRDSTGEARSLWKAHWHAMTVGKPGVQAARAALERGEEHGGS